MIGPLLKAAGGAIIPPWVKWLAIGLAAGALFVCGWTVNGRRLNGEIEQMKTANAQAKADAQEAARKKESDWNAKLQEAQHDAAIRERDLRDAAAAARIERDSLRDDLLAFQRDLSSLPIDAVRQRADALATVFGACVEEYTEVAESCGRHVIDKQKLMESWPK